MLAALRNTVGAHISDLPPGYVAVDYVRTTGNQFVDTGFYCTNQSQFWMDCEITACGGSCGIFGARGVTESYGGGPNWLPYGSLGVFCNNNFRLALNDQNYDSGWLTSKPAVSGARRVIEIIDRSIFVDGLFYVKSPQTGSYECSVATGLFNVHLKAGSVPSDWQYGSTRTVAMKFYGFSATGGGASGRLAVDIVPVARGGIGYLFERLSKTILTTEGGGSLIVD